MQSAVFLINSRSGLVSSTGMGLRSKCFTLTGAPSPEVTVPFCLVPSPEFSQAPWYSLPNHLCRFGVRFLVT
ncbi:IS1 transposase InsAB [Pseudomonas syringae pv. philadelphi]|uniref:IS1 transposase InsAB n=3 Tax=Pseudomonas syringae group TaxID=136849 RepID=A0A3M3QKJ4_PSECA|nr:IS1 transposase InsAB [Pseudomonas cannabina pv. alisalensis]RML71991.1 IS1 transposase InsAB [Pseudomonas syringae pv. syringae]RMN23831.1 IS1 transposase InsAB [Pseudomonas coronafaciens pv. zizaniae]RMN84746.1 IS1 transposase InsAB [Pseudomonas cannabina]RMO78855.1 IS1 transposase InsAB [Pseudomonas syringae pv. philadelphi]RMS27580.1 IS1 transposase InsAB [Pseudomonas syringae pv. aceris]RMT85517.1 IS1 transposase InsAB [Pseudomonas viridiflava]RMU27336.1 IS1 transposase InsAB [Pseudo